MNLEDHLGDVLSKARSSSGVSLEEAAAAAGLAPAAYTTLEESGVTDGAVNFSALGARLSLDGAKLAGRSQGWMPRPVQVGRWRELRQITTAGPGFTVNCFLVWDEATRDAALFDTGFEAGPIIDLVERNALELRHLFITHTHADHIAALEPLRARFPKVRLHSNAKGAPPEQRNRPTDFIHVGNLRVTNRDTPGHAEDGVTYVVGNWPDDAPAVAVVGDAIFAGSMGGAKHLAVMAKLKVRDQILSLPPETLICPGHGPLTTVGEERDHNPFF